MILFNRYALWPLLFVGHLLAVSLLAWHLLAQTNFAYPLGHKLLNIENHIREHGPENRYKQYFEKTTTQEQQEIFAQITDAVQNHGRGRAEISYRLPNGEQTPLMREAEVIHLQDVANLIDVFYVAGWSGTFLWLALLIFAWQQGLRFPSLKKISLGFGAGVLLIATITLLIGPEDVFYWLHVQIFPDEHEWFFFYQDSLMTTLMKAPDLFGFITVLLVALAIVFWGLSVWGTTRLLAPGKTDAVQAGPVKAPRKHRKRRKA